MRSLRKIKITTKVSKFLPQEPGVYIFWKEAEPIYVGKALNLKNRVSSYFSGTLLRKTSKMVFSANSLSFIPVISELEALLLEARLIRQYKPQYNSALKDDKSPIYIFITNDFYPRVITGRKGHDSNEIRSSYGPFPSSSSVRFVLRSLRRIFPFAEHKLGKRKCIYAHIGLCVPCPNEIESLEDIEEKKKLRMRYLRNVRYINAVLSGNLRSVRRELEVKMNDSARKEKYEDASSYKEAISKFDYITQPTQHPNEFLKNPNLVEDLRAKELVELKKLLEAYFLLPQKLKRIECYDVAHLAGTHSTASMVTFIDGAKHPPSYRHFKIKDAKKFDDISALSEVARRRIKYLQSWGKPDLIVVDGGKAQVSIFSKWFKKEGIPVIGIAKQTNSLVIPVRKSGGNSFKEIHLDRGQILFLIGRIRDEAHRFARRYHHKLVSKSLIS